MKLRRFGTPREEPPAGSQPEAQRVCPQCGASISVRAKTCIHCGTNIAALEAEARAKEKELQRRKREEVAQIPTRTIAVAVTLVIVIFIVGLVVQRTRESAVLALTPTLTPTYTPTATPTRTPLPTPTSAFTATPIPPLKYTVQSGDTPGAIAVFYGISVETLMSFNGKNADDFIIAGETLMIPIPTPQPTGTVTPVGNAPTAVASCESVYTVKKGDTLSTIAVDLKVSEGAIQSRNKIDNPDSLQIGQQLVISTCPTPTPTPPPPAPNATPTSLPSYGPAMLLTPLDGEIIVGNSAPVLLQWLSSGILRDNELYKVEITQVNGGKSDFTIMLATGWRVPTTLFPPPGDPNRTFKWTVWIIRQSGTGSDGRPIYNIVSPISEHTFEWLAEPPTPTPTVTPLPGSTRTP